MQSSSRPSSPSFLSLFAFDLSLAPKPLSAPPRFFPIPRFLSLSIGLLHIPSPARPLDHQTKLIHTLSITFFAALPPLPLRIPKRYQRNDRLSCIYVGGQPALYEVTTHLRARSFVHIKIVSSLVSIPNIRRNQHLHKRYPRIHDADKHNCVSCSLRPDERHQRPVLAPVIHGPRRREISPGGRCHVVGLDSRVRLPLPTLLAGEGVQRDVSERIPTLSLSLRCVGNRSGPLTQRLTRNCTNRLRGWRDLKISLSKLISLAGPRKNGEQSHCQLEASLRDNGITVAIEESPSQMPW